MQLAWVRVGLQQRVPVPPAELVRVLLVVWVPPPVWAQGRVLPGVLLAELELERAPAQQVALVRVQQRLLVPAVWVPVPECWVAQREQVRWAQQRGRGYLALRERWGSRVLRESLAHQEWPVPPGLPVRPELPVLPGWRVRLGWPAQQVLPVRPPVQRAWARVLGILPVRRQAL